MTGPTWQGLYGSTRTFQDGTSTAADDNYIRQSLMEPNAQVVSGFIGQMPSFQGQLEDEHVTALIEYIKTLK
jgi:cytochrome c oxidase subunit 2